MSPLSSEIRATASSSVAAAGLALRYPAFCNDISTAWRRLSDPTSEFLELVTSVTERRPRSVEGAGAALCATILSDRADAAQPATARRTPTSSTDRRLLKNIPIRCVKTLFITVLLGGIISEGGQAPEEE